MRNISPNAEVHLIPVDTDGIACISRVLKHKTDVQSIQVISHGRAGAIRLGGADIDLALINRRSAEISRWSNSLTQTADLLFLGCDVGRGSEGASFVQAMAKLSGCDVAASIDRTGHASFGGDWDLERLVGDVDVHLALSSSAIAQYRSYLPITIRAAGSTAEEAMQLQIDGVRVWVNGQPLIDDWNGHAVTINTIAAINLAAGQRYSIVVEHRQIRSYAVMQLSWKTPGATAFTKPHQEPACAQPQMSCSPDNLAMKV